ncbi:MAG: hypothetical protein A3F14_02585 [Gammaproteobacteria bacterium RIFCSPHIGHO2_12_FULL_43_28]|nr:MAG: hypothetical protein A3F14_02585 [Gammaproteobacteria bacterium RIFCSPHIGHO2_12_FULL_43_28]
MLTKHLVTGFLAIGISSVSSLVSANPLVLVNDTNFDSTSIINNGACSTIMGDTGITKAHTTNTVSEMKIKLACLANATDCKADIYMTNNCTGPKVAAMYFDTKTGIKADKTEIYDHTYNIATEAFKVSFSGGPAFLVKK